MTRSHSSSRWPSCQGNCGQGDRLCVTPQACQLPDPADDPEDAIDKVLAHPATMPVIGVVIFAVAIGVGLGAYAVAEFITQTFATIVATLRT